MIHTSSDDDSDSDDEEYTLERDENGKPMYGPYHPPYFDLEDVCDQGETLKIEFLEYLDLRYELGFIDLNLGILDSVNLGMLQFGDPCTMNVLVIGHKREFPAYAIEELHSYSFEELRLVKNMLAVCIWGDYQLEMIVRMFKPVTLANTYYLTNLQEAILKVVKKKNNPVVTSNLSRFRNGSSYGNTNKPAVLPFLVAK
ncbi:hypothetical protein Tco_0799403 [Tanacetum coccineum]|uniref:Uncharacterized protein n=1 Tax=Tanacetum coccineum TaxID=301880 RepID=A0ABQ4ZR85_9ASTR